MQTVSTTFNQDSKATTRNLSYYLRISWTRTYDASISFAVVGSSTVGSTDIIKGDSNEFITESDKFYFYNETEYVKQLEYERYLEEPNGGLFIAMGDLVLDNTTKRFTYGYDSEIGDFIKPQRVVRMGVGFGKNTIPVFEGVAKEVKENKRSRELSLHCRDYTDTFMGHKMDSAMFVNKRSDQIIEEILIDIGFNPNQYSLDVGLNTIGFASFDTGTKASDAIREICQAEEGYFYQDENGILRFENREHYSWDPHLGVQLALTTDEIIDMEYDYSSVINRCIVTAKPREVLGEQIVWSDEGIIEIPANGTITVWANYSYENETTPCSSIVTPVEGTDFITNTLSSGLGDNMSAYVEMKEFSSFAETAKMVLTNSHETYSAYLTTFQLRGTPAIIVNTISEVFENLDSVALYGEQILEIENDYIDNADYAAILSRRIVDKYSNPLRSLIIKIKGLPQLQIKDRISITDSDTDETKDYRLMRIRSSLNLSEGFNQELTLREISDNEYLESPHRIISSRINIS